MAKSIPSNTQLSTTMPATPIVFVMGVCNVPGNAMYYDFFLDLENFTPLATDCARHWCIKVL